jgi:hypothetical protein
MAGLPAIEQAFEIVGEPDPQMRVDAGLSFGDAEPNQRRLVNVNGPVKTILGRP